MQTLTYGYKKPQTGDRGSTVFPAMEDNIQRLNDHTHDGSNSSLLAPTAITASVASILAAAWTVDGTTGLYKQTVTMPTGLSFDNTVKEFRLADGTVFQPVTKKVTTSTYDIWINDNTETLSVRYR